MKSLLRSLTAFFSTPWPVLLHTPFHFISILFLNCIPRRCGPLSLISLHPASFSQSFRLFFAIFLLLSFRRFPVSLFFPCLLLPLLCPTSLFYLFSYSLPILLYPHLRFLPVCFILLLISSSPISFFSHFFPFSCYLYSLFSTALFLFPLFLIFSFRCPSLTFSTLQEAMWVKCRMREKEGMVWDAGRDEEGVEEASVEGEVHVVTPATPTCPQEQSYGVTWPLTSVGDACTCSAAFPSSSSSSML